MVSESDEDVLSRCRVIGTGTWSDALDACGIAGVVRGLTQRSGAGLFAGFAVTAHETAGDLGAFPRGDFGVGRILAAAGADTVLVIDLDGADVSTMGGLAALDASNRGVAAVLIDGGCRDVDEIQARGLWLASRHITPMTGKTRLRLDTINEPVEVGGIAIRPGDLVVGDPTGIVVCPRAALDRVLGEAERMVAMDRAMEHAIENGAPFTQAAAEADYIS
jgi:regulator of RNase E activity RraA